MEFKEVFRQKYRVALHAARADDATATIAGLTDLCQLFANQYSLKNRDSIVVKAELSFWKDTFEKYIAIIRDYGLQDRRIQKFFGLSNDSDIPSFGDITNSKDTVPTDEDRHPENSIDISGITGPEQLKETPVKPVAPHKEHEAEVLPPPVIPAVPLPIEESEKESKPVYTPDSLEGFIGQKHIVKALLKEIAIAKAKGQKYLDNILLFGNPGLGKTTLMSLIAKALGVKFELMDCSQYRNSQQSLKALQNFFLKVARDNEPVVIAFDEIHMLTTELQTSLLTLLNNRVYVSPPDVNGTIKRIPIDNFTFIAATTNDNEVLNTIKDRCLRLKFQMTDYTTEELKRIYQNKVASKGLTITDEAIDVCIPRSRGSIRYVNSFVDGLDVALYDDKGSRISTNIDKNTALRYFEEKGIDSIGLEKMDLNILRVIEEDTSGAIGAETLSARVGLDPKKYLSEYEPYLIKIGFVSVTGRGRTLTEAAIQHLKNGEHYDY